MREAIEEVFQGISLGEVEPSSFVECTFERCHFEKTDLSNCKFLDCRFIGCSWTLVKLGNTRIQGCTFVDSKLVGVDFTLCDTTFFGVDFEKCILHSCNFTEMKLKGMKFVDSVLKECHFAQADCRECSFLRGQLDASTFHNTNLLKADFTDATGYSIDPTNNQVQGAKFSTPEALSMLRGLGIRID